MQTQSGCHARQRDRGLGAVDVFRPFDLRFSDLTGRIVTLDTMIRIGILTIVVVGLNLLMAMRARCRWARPAFTRWARMPPEFYPLWRPGTESWSA